ncbi:hypothetical protein WJX82_010124 [Trebouxia sp. C0006]
MGDGCDKQSHGFADRQVLGGQAWGGGGGSWNTLALCGSCVTADLAGLHKTEYGRHLRSLGTRLALALHEWEARAGSTAADGWHQEQASSNQSAVAPLHAAWCRDTLLLP